MKQLLKTQTAMSMHRKIHVHKETRIHISCVCIYIYIYVRIHTHMCIYYVCICIYICRHLFRPRWAIGPETAENHPQVEGDRRSAVGGALPALFPGVDTGWVEYYPCVPSLSLYLDDICTYTYVTCIHVHEVYTHALCIHTYMCICIYVA